MQRIRTLWLELRSSLWFVPALTVVAMVALAVALIELGGRIPEGTLARFPRLFGAGAEGTRGMLSAIASSMITVAGVVFSITIVVLSLTSSQYSPRVLRNFMRDRTNQLVLGIFVGIYAYCLVVLRTIRGGDEAPFVPSLASLGAIVLAFVGVAVLIHFIHHISSAIQAGQILKAIREDAEQAIDRVFSDELGDDEDEPHDSPHAALAGREWQTVCAARTGYIQAIDWEWMLRIACKANIVVRFRYFTGGFVTRGAPLFDVASAAPDDIPQAEIGDGVSIGDQRTTDEDPEFGVRQIVDIALKALSPAVNDPTTAIMCLDNVGALLMQLLNRRFPSPFRFADGELRVIAPAPTFACLLARALDEIRAAAASNPRVLAHMARLTARLAEACRSPARRKVLAAQASNIERYAVAMEDPFARETVQKEVVTVRRALERR